MQAFGSTINAIGLLIYAIYTIVTQQKASILDVVWLAALLLRCHVHRATLFTWLVASNAHGQ